MDSNPESFTNDVDSQSFIIRATNNEIIKVVILGAIVGLIIPLVSFLIERFFIEPVFCRSADSFGVCASGGLTAYYVATGLLSAMAIAIMAHWQIFRPVLIAVGAAAALWGFKKYTGGLAIDSVLEYYIYSMLLFGFSYILFYWVMRLRVFVLSVVVAVLCVAFIRWAVIS